MKKTFFISKILPLAILIFVVQLVLGIWILTNNGEGQLKKDLNFRISRIEEDIKYNNGDWNISAYNLDPELLSTDPQYILTNDGFVLDRRSTIRGFLDSSDYKRLLDYTTAQNVKSSTGQVRRVYSRAILNSNEEPIGVVAVSYFDPQTSLTPTIDKQLNKDMNLILSEIKVKNSNIDVSNVKERNLSYNVSYIIVDKFNTVLDKTTNVNNIGRIPNFIDPSYVKHQLLENKFQYIQDQDTKEHFIVQTTPLLDSSKKNVLGVIVVAESSENLYNLINYFLLSYGILSLVLIIGGFYMGFVVLSKESMSASISREISKIWFDEKQCMLYIDKNQIEIPYSTNQYYLLRALFSNPSKRWETDEILDEFGELQVINTRKVYDAMVNINKRVTGYIQDKLIINQNKTYQLNQNLPIEKTSK